MSVVPWVTMKQQNLFSKENMSYGGELRKKRKGRVGGRPLSVRHTMHLVLRSSKAVKDRSLNTARNSAKIKAIFKKFSQKYHISILSLALVGNHLHVHLKLNYRDGYKPFIRAITAAIAMAVMGKNRWNPLREKFWDYRPFTRIVVGFRAFRAVEDYVAINELEGQGYPRDFAEFLVRTRCEVGTG